MPGQTQVRRHRRFDEEIDSLDAPVSEDEADERREEVLDEVDEMIDEIDTVLETNPEDFVHSYIQKGGQ